ncbi:MAG TPA: HNH endonuclease [Desulfobacteraceae bacterium]|nr:HNH endonuclease [Desulfobacteraceae bacterium]|tara:strand:- start:653 stop:1201 length:549 start_codon:yes stop_codon:yes gene_type:complete
MARHKYTPEQIEFIRQGFKEYTMKDLTVLFNKRFGTNQTTAQLKSFAGNRNIRSGRRPSLKKNFKPPNCKPLGAERICKRDNLILIKVAETDPLTGCPTRYKYKHVHVYEQHHGPVPEDKVVTFLDGDSLNCDPANLTAVTWAELMAMKRNRYRLMPDELRPTVLALSKLQAKAFTLAKNAG